MNNVEKMVRLLEFADTGQPIDRHDRKRWILTLAAAASVTLAVLLLTVSRPSTRTLIDTYESPELAYAKVEEVFQHISSSIDKSIDRTEVVYFKIRHKL